MGAFSEVTCGVCGKTIKGQYLHIKDQGGKGTLLYNICLDCNQTFRTVTKDKVSYPINPEETRKIIGISAVQYRRLKYSNFQIVMYFPLFALIAIATFALMFTSEDLFPVFAFLCGISALLAVLSSFQSLRALKRRREHPHWREELFFYECCDSGIKDAGMLDREENRSKAASIASKLEISGSWKQAFEVGQQQERQRWLNDESWSDTLYALCMEQGIKDLSSSSDIARLNLMAEQQGIPLDENELKQCYILGKNRAENKANADEQNRISVLREEEIKEAAASKHYIDLFGREKMIQMSLDRAEWYRQVANAYRQQYHAAIGGLQTIYNEGKERESDWAIHGGIADGIAGGAAGLAVARDVQNRNAEKREHNAALLNTVAQVGVQAVDQYMPKIIDAQDTAKKYTALAEQAKMLLVQELPEKDLLTRLNPTVKELTITDTGAVKLSVRTDMVTDVVIYDNVPAMIDGTFKAILLLDGKNVGEMFFTMPPQASKYNHTNQSICCCESNVPAQNYDVIFEPYRLWAIEYKQE